MQFTAAVFNQKTVSQILNLQIFAKQTARKNSFKKMTFCQHFYAVKMLLYKSVLLYEPAIKSELGYLSSFFNVLEWRTM